MINVKKLIPAIVLLFTFSNNAFCGAYSEKGYITKVKANYQGSECVISLSTSPESESFQDGHWPCNSINGQNMLNVAKMAKIMQYKTVVSFEGDGSINRPVYSISIEN